MSSKKLISSKKKEEQGALAVQVGGGHYKDLKIQPIEYAMANNLNFCQGNVVKYITRYKAKNGLEDLKKVKHYVDLLIEIEYAEQIKAEEAAAKKKEQNKISVARSRQKKSFELRKKMSRPAPKKLPLLTPSKELAAIVGEDKQSRVEIVKKIWAYVKKNNLQDQKNKRNINCDEKMKAVFKNKEMISMFEMAPLISKHLK